MDKLLWITMSGAKENFNSLAVRSNNLANANTAGFKQDMENARSMPVFGNAYPTRVFAMAERPGYNMQGGAMMTTERNLDIAVQGEGFIAVNDRSGSEAYTRFGSLRVDSDGVLRTSSGLDVLDVDGSQIVLPGIMETLQIGRDGVISGRPEGADADVVEEYQTVKLVKPDNLREIEKGDDGLFRRSDGTTMAADDTVRLASGMLEASNVNPVEEIASLIRIQRSYDTQIKMMATASEMDEAQDNLLSYS